MAVAWDDYTRLAGYTAFVLIVSSVGRFLYKLYTIRSMFRGLPGPPHHPIWGHLHLMPSIVKAAPNGIAAQSMVQLVNEKYDLGDIWYVMGKNVTMLSSRYCLLTISSQVS